MKFKKYVSKISSELKGYRQKVDELENMAEPTGKDIKKLEAYQNNLPVYEAIIAALNAAVSDEVYYSPAAFMPVLTKALATATADKKLLEKIADGLSVMDKKVISSTIRKPRIRNWSNLRNTLMTTWLERCFRISPMPLRFSRKTLVQRNLS